MRASRKSYDVVVVGAGPVGVTAAIAHARLGARVALLEADPRASRRFAGEWLHPTGVEVLDALRVGRLERARARAGYGFVIHPDDRSAPIAMPYAEGVALSGEHASLVEALRDVARGVDGVEWIPFARVVGVDAASEGGDDGARVRVEDRERFAGFELRASRVIGADGRASVVRQALGYHDQGSCLSYMASLELRGAQLPLEGFGHVVLGGPGPALFYRIADDVIRGCLDVPVSFGARARTPSFLWDAFHAVLPSALLPAFRTALQRGPVGWAANRFRPRARFGRGAVALVGDALGHVHPMTAIGMTMGMLDARALASSKDLDAYARARRAQVPELLSNALYHCFRREDPSATGVRRAMFETLREDEGARRRTMAILAGDDRGFTRVFLEIAARAISTTITESATRGEIGGLPRALATYGEWMAWPLAAAMPGRAFARARGTSTSTEPLSALARIFPSADPLASPESEEPRGDAPPEVPLRDAIERGSAALLAELEAIALLLGTVPDADLGGPALRMMHAITSTAMRPGMAARMTLGRRRLAVEGVPRLFDAGEVRTAMLAELLLVLLDGTPWSEEPIAELAEAVRVLLAHQTDHGGFAGRAPEALPPGHEGDLESTALACRAIDVVARRRPDASDADLEGALARAGAWVRARQRHDGSFAASSRSSGADDGPIVSTALAIEALIAVSANPGEPAVRRAIRHLNEHADAWSPSTGSPGVDPRVAARVVRAACAACATSSEHVLRAVRALSASLAASLGSEARAWETTAEVVEALGAFETRRAERPLVSRARGGAVVAPASVTGAAIVGVDAADWTFCREALGEVSRTFSRPIAMLPRELEVAVTLGYLLCRIADTIEDHPAVPPEARDRLFAVFLGVLERGEDPGALERAFAAVDGDDPELRLARSTAVVMRVFASRPERTRAACVRWVAEMARGMQLFSQRPPGEDGLVGLHTVEDLDRYCYYVAGTVGHLLTDLFLDELGEPATSERALSLREHAEGFATGLQMVNVLKDVTEDQARGVSFVPRTLVARQGIGLAALCEPSTRARAHAAVAPLFERAREHLDAALRYALSIPPSHTGIRLFCLLPLWMAARTLVLARGNDAMFAPDRDVKISRDEVESLIGECVQLVADDDALRARYARLYANDALPARTASR